MEYFINFIVVSVAFGSFLKHTAAQSQNNVVVQGSDNAEQFALLCRVYNVAKNPPINHVDLPDPHEIVNKIDTLNASFSEENQHNETEKVRNSSDAQAKSTTTREAAIAQAILKRITQKAHTILEDIKKTNATRDIEKVKSNFSQVIFGEGMNESHFCDGALKDVGERDKACGAAGLHAKGQSAGNNLVVDFLCLCAQRNDEGIHDACRVKVGSKSEKHSWGSGAPSGSLYMWSSIKKECENLLHQNPKSTEQGYEVLEDFLKHLKLGGLYRWGDTSSEGSERKKGMLGTGMGTTDRSTDLVCDGKKGVNGKKQRVPGPSPGGICVYYGEENWSENIAWMKKIKTALNTVDNLNNQTATIQRNIEKLQTLLHRAEKIYETMKVISEIQTPVVLTNLQTAAKRLTAYNAARKHKLYHLMAPCWLLLY